MKILHKYLTRDLLTSFSLALLVFTFLLMVGRILPEVLPMLARRVPSLTLLQYFALLIPYLLTFAIPMSMLTATLLLFGRLSADNELTAIRASGVSLLSLIAPSIVISIALVFVCLAINCYVAPLSRFAHKNMLLEVGMKDPTALIEEGKYTSVFPGYLIYAQEKKSNTLSQINVYCLDDRGHPTQNLCADSAIIYSDLANEKLVLELLNVRGEIRDPDEPDNLHKMRPGIRARKYPITFDVGRILERARSKRDYDDMTFGELLSAIYDLRKKGIAPSPLWLEAHKRVSGSFACFAFVLIGMPLGIKTHRRETSIGVAVALILVFTYYFFVILAQTFENKPQYYPEIILWAPNIVFEFLGLILLWRVSRA